MTCAAAPADVDPAHGHAQREARAGRGLDQHLLERVAVDGDAAADTWPPSERELADRGPRGVHDLQRLDPEAGVGHGSVEPEITEHPLAVGIEGDTRAVGPPARVPLDEVDLDPRCVRAASSRKPGDPTTRNEHTHRHLHPRAITSVRT